MGEWFQRFWTRLTEDFLSRFSIEQWSRAAQHLFDSLVVILLAAIAIWLVRRLLRRIERRVERMRGAGYRRRIETITSLIHSAIKYAIFVGAGLAILTVWQVADTAALAFGTAAVGAAIGFGSQGLVQDVITGLSILAEDQLAVGDYVEAGGKAGVVEEIGLRVIKLRDQCGVQHTIFNRMVSTVSNYPNGAIEAAVDVFIEQAADGEAAQRLAEKVCCDMAAEVPYFAGVPVVEGVRQSSTNDVFVRIALRVLASQQAAINDLFVDRLKRAFAAEQLTIPGGRVRVVIISARFLEELNPAKAQDEAAGAAKTAAS